MKNHFGAVSPEPRFTHTRTYGQSTRDSMSVEKRKWIIILRMDDGFQFEDPPTKKPGTMIYFYTKLDGTERIIYTDGRERRFTSKGAKGKDCHLTHVLMEASEGIERFTQRGYTVPSTYTHVRVYVVERDNKTLDEIGWKTLCSNRIKKVVPVFTMSDKESYEFGKKYEAYEENSGKTLFEHMAI